MNLKRFSIHRPPADDGIPSPVVHVIGDDMKQKYFNKRIEIYFKGERVAFAPVGCVVVATIITEEQV